MSLFEAKRAQHPNVHAFQVLLTWNIRQSPRELAGPAGSGGVIWPRLGYFGVIDERLDRELLAAVARLDPDLQLILVGPVLKIDPASLPQAANIHYLGRKAYSKYRLSSELGRGDDALRSERRDPLYEPNKNSGIFGGGGYRYSDHRRSAALGISQGGADRRDAREFVAEASAALALVAYGQGWLDAVDRGIRRNLVNRAWEQMVRAIETAGLRIAGRRRGVHRKKCIE